MHSQGVPRVQEQPHIVHCAILTRCHPTLRWGQEQQEPSTAQHSAVTVLTVLLEQLPVGHRRER